MRFLLLLFLLPHCGDAYYRLDGVLPHDATHVALLDSAATEKADRLRGLYFTSRDSVVRVADQEIAEVKSRLGTSEDDLTQAKARLSEARRRYTRTFEGIKQFQSFGGNAIFANEDRSVPTRNLLSEIANRYYKGKAFSLETGGKIRSFVRERLVPAERRLSRARRQFAKVEGSQKSDEAAMVATRDSLNGELIELSQVFNQRILDTLTGAVLQVVKADSVGYYCFARLSPARYHLYLQSPEPTLVSIVLSGHARRDLVAQTSSPLLIPGDHSL